MSANCPHTDSCTINARTGRRRCLECGYLFTQIPTPPLRGRELRAVDNRHRRRSAQDAVFFLRQAAEAAAQADAPRLRARIRAALSSAYGAVRNAECRETRES